MGLKVNDLPRLVKFGGSSTGPPISAVGIFAGLGLHLHNAKFIF